jgi:hypothetical protein
MTSMPANFPVAKGGVTIHGILVDIDTVTGHAKSIRRVAEPHAPEVVAPADGSPVLRDENPTVSRARKTGVEAVPDG